MAASEGVCDYQPADFVHSLSEEVFVIGGAALCRQALPLASRLYLAEIEQGFDGDVFFPDYSPQDSEEISRQPSLGTSGPQVSFVIDQRRRK